MVYDPVKAHEYYERTKQLKGRPKAANVPKKASGTGSTSTTSTKSSPTSTSSSIEAKARVVRLKQKTVQLETALTETLNALAEKRRSAAETEKKNSDGNSTEKEKQASQEYRDRNRGKLKSERSKDSSSGGSSSSTQSVSSMSVDELNTRVTKIRTALNLARDQLSSAQRALGSLSHSNLRASGILDIPLTLRPEISRKDSVKMTADFSGYATRNNLRCSDGRTILADAFKGDDGEVVPLVWQHGHNEPTNILGHVKLENRADGVYAHAFFNQTPSGQHAKESVRNGDIRFLSIYANQLVEKAKQVIHGKIREVSLVVAGANPGAFIDNVNIAHADGDGFVELEDEAYITTGVEIEAIAHAAPASVAEPETGTETIQDILDTLNPKQADAVNFLLSQALTQSDDAAVQHTDSAAEHPEPVNDNDGTSEETPAEGESDADETDTEADPALRAEGDADAGPVEEAPESTKDANAEEEPEAAEGDADAAEETSEDEADDADTETDPGAGDAVQHNDSQEDDSMTHNLFDQAKKSGDAPAYQQQHLAHADVRGIMENVIRGGSLKTALEDYALEHGIENIEYLFPDPKLLDNSPNFLSRRMEWVQSVLNAVRKTPFARIRTAYADITADEARARGYIKGNMKNEEFFELIRRDTTPQTVYKKQKLDRDDVIDITDLDVVAWVKAEMRVMLDEEIASAILIGDGRSNGDEDKIKEDKIRPIASDSELYTTTVNVNIDDASSSIEELVDAVIANRRYYKGTGLPTFYTSETVIASFLNVKNGFGQRIYKNLSEVAEALRVSAIVPVDTFERVSDLVGIMVNLVDYSIGTDRGGQATMFDDFDLDYNKLRYLLETRLCGALTMPKAAVVFRKVAASSVLRTPTEPAFEDNEITVPTITGVVYKDEAGNTMTTGSPVEVTAENSPFKVFATPASGSHFANNAEDEWSFSFVEA